MKARAFTERMCGIAGQIEFNTSRDPRELKATVEAMMNTLQRRGPDDSGSWADGTAGLGHRRLAVVDIEGGKQPMVVRDGAGSEIVLSFSGEIYNYRELRTTLIGLGHRFYTQSDTEVLLRSHIEWGDAAVERLDGMYAYALYNSSFKRLALFRDRMGVKPLYYRAHNGRLDFGSEPKAILASSEAPGIVTCDGLRELFSIAKLPGHAIWNNISEVQPGTSVSFDAGGLRTQKYWRLMPSLHSDTAEETVRRTRELLYDAVRKQLTADVPVCTLLSGGLDSSILAGIGQEWATRLCGPQASIRTFAVDYRGQEAGFKPEPGRPTRDIPYAQQAARYIGSCHTVVTLDSAEMAAPEIRRTVIEARDAPTGLRSADQSLFLLFREIKKECTVAISGEAADEIFGGYPWFADEAVLCAHTFPWQAGRPSDPQRLLRPEIRAALDLDAYNQAHYESAIAEVPRVEGEGALEARMREVRYLHLTRMVRSLLDRKDRTSMAASLEVRVPFCDHQLVEYAFNTPWRIHRSDGWEKSVLRAAGYQYIPDSIAKRRKSGYPSNHSKLYLNEVQRQVREHIRNDHDALKFYDSTVLMPLTEVPVEHFDYQSHLAIEQFLNFATWLDYRNPSIQL